MRKLTPKEQDRLDQKGDEFLLFLGAAALLLLGAVFIKYFPSIDELFNQFVVLFPGIW